MSDWIFTVGTICGLVSLIAAGVLVGINQVGIKGYRHPRWLIPGLSIIACGGFILYGSSLLGSLYIQMTRLVTVFGRVP
jgi:hypothetical protein